MRRFSLVLVCSGLWLGAANPGQAEDLSQLRRATYFQEADDDMPPLRPATSTPSATVSPASATDAPAPPTQTVTTPAPAGAPPAVPPADALYTELQNQELAYASRFGPIGPEAPDSLLGCYGLHLYVDAGFDLMQPVFEGGNPAFLVTRPAKSGAAAIYQTHNFDYDLAFAPRIEWGIQNDRGWGFRMDWSRFDQESTIQPKTPSDPTHLTTIRSVSFGGIPGLTSPSSTGLHYGILHDKLDFASRLVLEEWDWELYKELQLGSWRFVGSTGVRYVHMVEDYLAVRSNSGTGRLGRSTVTLTQDADVINAGHNFDGLGPTWALDALRPIGCTAFTLYGTLRTSVLFGDARDNAYQRTVLVGKIVPTKGHSQTLKSTLTFGQTTLDEDDILPVEELEFGIQWVHRHERILVFVRSGFLAQLWVDAGNATRANGDLGFVGLMLTAGLAF